MVVKAMVYSSRLRLTSTGPCSVPASLQQAQEVGVEENGHQMRAVPSASLAAVFL